MKKSILLLTLCLFAASQIHAGDVTGTITFKGAAPAEKELTPIKDDPNCAALYPAGLPKTKFYVVDASGNLADVIVTIKGVAGATSTGASAAPAVLDQKGALYVPQILAIQTGQKLIVKNSDPLVHNVHTTPTANPESNQVQMGNGPDLTYTFAKPEAFLKFKCDVHPWMFAWVSVLDHPYFAVSSADGKFTIKNVPAGKYTIEAAHRKLGTQTAEIEVKADGATQSFSFEKK